MYNKKYLIRYYRTKMTVRSDYKTKIDCKIRLQNKPFWIFCLFGSLNHKPANYASLLHITFYKVTWPTSNNNNTSTFATNLQLSRKKRKHINSKIKWQKEKNKKFLLQDIFLPADFTSSSKVQIGLFYRKDWYVEMVHEA